MFYTSAFFCTLASKIQRLTMYIDTHSHLYSEDFENDIDDVIARAKAVGVSSIVLPDISSKERTRLENLVKKDSKYFHPMIGLHPSDVKENYREELDIIEKKISQNQYVGIGETGLDYYWDTQYKKEQIEAFEFQINLSLKYDLPICIHIRDAFEDSINMLKKYKDKHLKGVVHCFTGNLEQAKSIINCGLYLGIGGVSTFKNTDLREILKEIDISNIILETDSPYLAPFPYRGKRNESSYIIKIAEELQSVYSLDSEKIGDITTENAKQLFNI